MSRHLYISWCESYFGELSGDDCNELFIADASISVLIGIVNHLVDIGGGEVLAHTSCHLLEILRAEAASASDVKGFVELLEGGLGLTVTKAEDVEEEGEVNFLGSAVVADDVQDLLGLVIKAKCSDGVDQLFRRDVATVIVVEDVEALLQLCHVCLLHVLPCVLLWVESLNTLSFTLLITLDMLIQ